MKKKTLQQHIHYLLEYANFLNENKDVLLKMGNTKSKDFIEIITMIEHNIELGYDSIEDIKGEGWWNETTN